MCVCPAAYYESPRYDTSHLGVTGWGLQKSNSSSACHQGYHTMPSRIRAPASGQSGVQGIRAGTRDTTRCRPASGRPPQVSQRCRGSMEGPGIPHDAVPHQGARLRSVRGAGDQWRDQGYHTMPSRIRAPASGQSGDQGRDQEYHTMPSRIRPPASGECPFLCNTDSAEDAVGVN